MPCSFKNNILKSAMFTSSVTAFSEAASFSPASCVADGLLPVTEDSRERVNKALDHPRLALHNNDSERDIRPVAKHRNILGSTKSNLGRKFRDGLLTVKQTCFRLDYNFLDYLQLWFKGDLAELIRNRYRAETA